MSNNDDLKLTRARTSFAEAVLDLVARIPASRVLTYGDVAEYLGTGGPRQVGTVLATEGGSVPWWRVVRSDGTIPARLRAQAMSHWQVEGTAIRDARVDMPKAKWSGDVGAL
ncbi:MAG: MGMT family protein [Actinomycetota bacterium]